MDFWQAALLAVVPVAATLTAVAMNQRQARRLAQSEQQYQASAAHEERLFRARESRYVDRRDAVIELVAAASDEADRVDQFEMQHGQSPGDIHEDYSFSKLNSAVARMTLLATPDVAVSAEALRDALVSYFNGVKGSGAAYHAATTEFVQLARAMLSEDAGS